MKYRIGYIFLGGELRQSEPRASMLWLGPIQSSEMEMLSTNVVHSSPSPPITHFLPFSLHTVFSLGDVINSFTLSHPSPNF